MEPVVPHGRMCGGCLSAAAAEKARLREAAEAERAARAAEREAEKARRADLVFLAERREAQLARARAWRAANPGRQRELSARWRKSDRETAEAYRERQNMAKKARNAVVRCALPRGFIRGLFAAQRGRCAYCRGKLVSEGPAKFHIDHIVPLAAGGAHAPSNLQLACPGCNVRKGARDPVDFARSIGLLV